MQGVRSSNGIRHCPRLQGSDSSGGVCSGIKNTQLYLYLKDLKEELDLTGQILSIAYID